MDNDCQVYHDIRDLEQFGIISLTGEACGLAMRILCDLTEEGVNLIREFMRVEPTADAWNSKGVKSIMLPTCIMQDLWIFAHVRAGTANVFLGGYVFGHWTETHYEEINVTLKHPDKTWTNKAWAVNDPDMMKRLHEREGVSFYISRTFKRSDHPGTGLDNTHTMTGRTI